MSSDRSSSKFDTHTLAAVIALRPCSVLRASRRQASSAIGADLLQQPRTDDLIHGLSDRFGRNVC